MKIPKKINIFGMMHKVTVMPNLAVYGQRVSGLFLPSSHQIFIEADQEKEEMLHTFLHECGHAILDRISVGQTGLSTELEEIIVDSFARFITENFHLRPKK